MIYSGMVPNMWATTVTKNFNDRLPIADALRYFLSSGLLEMQRGFK